MTGPHSRSPTGDRPGRITTGQEFPSPPPDVATCRASTEPVPTAKRDPDDDYGWWDLAGGTYLLSYNERLAAPPDLTVVLQTRDAVRARGAFHPTLHLDGEAALEAVPLTVGDGGLELKENARVSTLRSL